MLMEFTTFADDEYLSLTSFRNGGEPVTKRVRFAQVGGKLYVLSEADEAERIRRNAQVEVAPCTERGQALSRALEAMAVVAPDDQVARRALRKKYGLRQRVREVMQALRGARSVYLEVTPM